MTRDWVIVGGGIHGVHIAARLIGECGVEPDDLLIVDPGQTLLQRWRTCTEVTGMKHLRSPAVHHLDLDPWSLKQFGSRNKNKQLSRFASPYDRPALALFNAHCDEVIEHYTLDRLHLRARAMSASLDCDGVTLSLSTEQTVAAQNLVLAVGGGEVQEWPDWAPQNDERVSHVFATDFDTWPTSHESVLVVGGGISAAQISLRLMNEGHDVHLLSRHGLRQHQFDSEPGWLGPRFMKGFGQEKSLDRRRELITDARHKGSVPPDVWRALHRAIDRKQIYWHQDDIERVDCHGEHLNIGLRSGDDLSTQRILLATGFSGKRPGGPFVDSLIRSADLPCAGCGYPIVDEVLRWHPRIYTSGPLAELELGPTARNIAGARRAADRIVKALDVKDVVGRKAS